MKIKHIIMTLAILPAACGGLNPEPAFAQEADPTADLRRQIQDLNNRLNALEKPAAPAADANASTEPQKAPFGFADFTWLNGNPRTETSPLDSKYFTGEFRLDANYVQDFPTPSDHTLDGSCETGRTNELQVQQLGLGGDFHDGDVHARFMTQFGMYSQMTPRNDSSPAKGQWDLSDAYRYVSEAYGGYHWDKGYGVNLDAGIFMSYIGLASYYNFDNWMYQPSYVSANTPWFFNGLRLQTFPTEKLKVEYWLINGWQSYGQFNNNPGLGAEILYRPTGNVSLVSNDYWGYDTPGDPARQRFHSDNSVQVKYYDRPDKTLDRAAFSLTVDAGCENGDGVSCTGSGADPAQYFLGFMAYNRLWFDNNLFGLTVGGGAITNPGRYLVLLPPINGATASTGSPYFTANPGDQFKAWDCSVTFDYMPEEFVTWRFELNHRQASVPYFTGADGLTPPGGNTGDPASVVTGWTPDLSRTENRINLALLIKL